MKVRRIPKHQLAQRRTEPWVDPTRRPYCRDGWAYLPVRDGLPYDLDLPERRPYTGPGYQRLGDTLLLHGRAPDTHELQTLIDWEHPACILLLNHHTGIMRLPDVTVLYGTPSQGNRLEKQRIRSLIRPGERVADMFAGIGYFTLSAALAGAHVHAMEINPDSCAYLRKNAEANGVADAVTIDCGDCRTHLSPSTAATAAHTSPAPTAASSWDTSTHPTSSPTPSPTQNPAPPSTSTASATAPPTSKTPCKEQVLGILSANIK